jgi:hypothetical protein
MEGDDDEEEAIGTLGDLRTPHHHGIPQFLDDKRNIDYLSTSS